MSLFQAREWWGVQAGQNEEFDVGCMCVANIDNEPDGTKKIITGSLQGVLRMYCPKQKEYKIQDLILEKDMETPILQVAAGRFVQGCQELCLALLFPSKLSVYMVSAVSSGGSVNYYSLAQAYEHNLSRPAFNMCFGPFGCIRDRDYICVQSLDGVLSFFEQDSFAFSRLLSPTFLMPGPICYMAKFDLFIICNNAMFIEAYRYKVLAAAAENVDQVGGNADQKSADTGSSGKKVQVDWSTNIGEHAQHIEVTRFSRSLPANQQEILVVGERSIFTIKENGGIRLQKRISEYSVSAALSYRLPNETPDAPPSYNLLISTHQGHLMVFKEMTLVWCARLQGMTPVQLAVEPICDIRGMIICMDSGGKLQVCYMGTDPPTAGLVNTEMKELNYDEMEEEHQELLQIIRQSHAEGGNRDTEEVVTIESQVPPGLDNNLDEDSCADEPLGKIDGAIMQCTVHLFVTLKGSKAVEKVTVTLKTPSCFAVSQTSVHFEKLTAQQPQVIPIVFRVWNTMLCSSLDVVACASYYTANNEPRTVVHDFRLPIALVAKVIPPVKTAAHKISLDCNRSPPQLQALFQGLLSQPHVTPSFGNQLSNILSVQYVSGTEATVVMSKSSSRFSVQASEFAALWALTEETCLRLAEYFSQIDGRDHQDPFEIVYQESLPLHDLFMIVDDHFQLRKHHEEYRSMLADRTHQYRVIQKRLLVRFKDRNPSPLNHLDSLLNLTFEQTVQLMEMIEEVENSLRMVSSHLSAATNLVLLLLRFRFELDEENFRMLLQHFTAEVGETIEQGWEEQVDASLAHLLRTSLAASSKDRSSVPAPMKPLQDTLKLKKKITSVVDRLANGGRSRSNEVLGDEEAENLGTGDA